MKTKIPHLILAGLLGTSIASLAATYTWTGASTNRWDNAANWSGGVPAVANTTDIIISGTSNLSMASGNINFTTRSLTYDATNDGSTGFQLSATGNPNGGVRNLTFSADSGNATLTVDADSTGNKSITRSTRTDPAKLGRIILTSSLDVVHNGSGILTLGNGDQVTNYGAKITGAGGINKSGTGTLRLSGANDYTGDTVVNAGTLSLNQVNALQNSTLDTGTSGSQSVTFDLAGNNTYNIGGLKGADALAIGANTISVGSNDQSTSYTGILSGTDGNLVKEGTGTLTLSGANSYTGLNTVSAGTLKIGNVNALGAHNTAVSKVTVASGATVDFNGIADATYGYTISGTGVGGNGALVNNGLAIGTNKAQASNITLAADASIGGTGDWALLASGYGATTLDLAGNTLTKSGANTFTLVNATVTAGSLQIDEGTVSLARRDSDLSDVAVSLANTAGATLDLNNRNLSVGSLAGGGGTGGNVALGTGTLTVGALNTPSTTYAGVISGTGGLTKNGTGTLTLSGNNSYTGLTTVNDGTLVLGNSNAAVNIEINNGASLQSSVEYNTAGETITFGASGGGSATWGGSRTRVGSATFVTTGGSTNSMTGSLFEAFGGTVTYNVADGTDAVDLQVSNSHNRAGITKNGAGTLSLTSTANNLQTNVLDINAGVVELGGAGRLVAGNYSGNITNDGIFRHNSTNNQTLNGVISGTGAIEKDNTGTLTLTGANTYSGTTTVSNGTLTLSAADNNIANSTSIDVASGATLDVSGITNGFALANGQTLSGAGTVTGGMTITLGSVISPGNSPGTLSTGAQTWNDGGSYLWEINASDDAGGTIGNDPGWDWLDITGALDLTNLTAGGFTIDIDSLTAGNIAGDAVGFDTWTKGSPGDFDYSFTIATASSGISGFDADNFTLDSSGFSNAPGWDWGIVLSGNSLVLQAYALPEPSSSALLGLGGLALMLRRKRS